MTYLLNSPSHQNIPLKTLHKYLCYAPQAETASSRPLCRGHNRAASWPFLHQAWDCCYYGVLPLKRLGLQMWSRFLPTWSPRLAHSWNSGLALGKRPGGVLLLLLENPGRAVSLARKELARGAPSLMLLCRSAAQLCKKIKKGKKERKRRHQEWGRSREATHKPEQRV